MKKQTIKLALFVFVVAILGYAVYMAYTDITKSKKERFTDGAKLKIALYKATWCSHCTKFIESNVFQDTYAAVKDKYDDVVFATYDFDENKKLAEQYNVNSFPTIIAVNKDGKLLDTFDGDRSNKAELMRFVEANRQKA